MTDRSGGALIRAVGLVADGPLLWGRQLPARAPGIYVVEWPAPAPHAPIDHRQLRAWLERVPGLRLDGKEPTPHELAARLGSFWLPDQTVVYVGMTTRNLAGRVAALLATPLGDPRPHHGGHWLKTLQDFERCRIWWAQTDAPEEYEDALLTTFAEWVGRPDALPYANLASPTGHRRAHGITGAARAETDTEGRLEPPAPPATPPRPVAARSARVPAAPRRAPAASRRAPKTAPAAAEPAHLTADGLARLQAELEDLRTVRRPEVIARVRAARELGDLRENSEYHAAREEQSFLEGRMQQLQALLDRAVVVERDKDGLVAVGSEVVVESEGEHHTYHIVGGAESDPRRGRISYHSPIGQALLGHRAGDQVTVATPAGPRELEVVEVR